MMIVDTARCARVAHTYVGIVDGELQKHGSCILVNPSSSLESRNLVIDSCTVTTQLSYVTAATVDVQFAVERIRVDVLSTTVRVLVRASFL